MGATWQRFGKLSPGRDFLRAILLAWTYCSIVAPNVAAEPSEHGRLPILVFQTYGKAVQDRTRIPVSLTLLKPTGGNRPFVVDEVTSGRAELSVRGNSSSYELKKSYRLELQDKEGKDRKAVLLGMPSNSDWVLYASVTDRTFARNLLGHELWRSTGRYAVRWRLAEVFVVTNSAIEKATANHLAESVGRVLDAISASNSVAASLVFSNANDAVAFALAGSYAGMYVVMEKLKRGPERVDIKKLRPEHDQEPEISGGYILKKDDTWRGQGVLLTGQELGLLYEEPKESEITVVQKRWMAKYLDDFERALFGLGFRDPTEGYRKFIDVESFIDFHWLVEVSKNEDGYMFSQYMHKDRGGKLTMGPVWDWDNAFGNPRFAGHRTNGWRFERAIDPDYTWYRRLFEDPDFLQRYMDRWSELRANAFATSNIVRMVDGVANDAQVAHRRNSMLWELDGWDVCSIRAKAGVSYRDEVNELKVWLRNRLAWIDSQEYPKPLLQRNTSTNGAVISMAALDGRLFYTTNGVDPRVSGGGVSPVAVEYSKPVEVNGPLSVTARARSKFGLWSAPVRLTVLPELSAARSGARD